jgi:hypothetical protein
MQSKQAVDTLRRKSKADNPLYRVDFDSTQSVSLSKIKTMKMEIETSVWKSNKHEIGQSEPAP